MAAALAEVFDLRGMDARALSLMVEAGGRPLARKVVARSLSSHRPPPDAALWDATARLAPHVGPVEADGSFALQEGGLSACRAALREAGQRLMSLAEGKIA